MMRITYRALLLAAVGAAVLAPAAAAKEKVVSATGMYDQRYCEYLFAKGTIPNLTATVFNTYRLNDCPPDQWAKSDAKKLAADEGALFVLLNGPRYWLIESASLSNPGKVKSFDGLRMRELTTVKVPIVNGVPS